MRWPEIALMLSFVVIVAHLKENLTSSSLLYIGDVVVI